MKRFLGGLALGIAGVALALGLTLGALAVAGPHVGTPPTPPVITVVREPSPTASPSGDHREGRGEGKEDGKASPSPAGSTATPSVSDDHSGSGSDDHSGSGSDGSGSDDHSGSGSGSDDDGPDDD